MVFVGIFKECELGSCADDVEGLVEEEGGLDCEIDAFVGLDGADIEEVVGAGGVVAGGGVCGGREVICADRWVDDDGVAVVGFFDLIGDEV